MRKTAEIDLIVCDSCDTQEVLGDSGDTETPEVPVGWFAGTVISGDDQDERSHEWAACKPAHIKNAILTVLDLV